MHDKSLSHHVEEKYYISNSLAQFRRTLILLWEETQAGKEDLNQFLPMICEVKHVSKILLENKFKSFEINATSFFSE